MRRYRICRMGAGFGWRGWECGSAVWRRQTEQWLRCLAFAVGDAGHVAAHGGGVEEARERGVEELLDAKDAQIARLAAQIEDLREAQQRGAAGAEGRTGGRGEGDGTSVEEAKAEVEKVLKLLEDEKQRRESLEQERALER